MPDRYNEPAAYVGNEIRIAEHRIITGCTPSRKWEELEAEDRRQFTALGEAAIKAVKECGYRYA